MKRRNFIIILINIFFFLFTSNVYAGSANFAVTGNSSVYNGNTITVKINLNSTDSSVRAFGGYISYDANILELQSCSSTDFNAANKKIAYLDMSGNGIKSGQVGTCTFKAINIGSTTVTVNSITAADSSSNLTTSISGKYISVVNPPSENNNLSSLSINGSSISVAGNKTNYETSVSADVTSVNISATTEDSKASISGTGTKELNYGDNKITLTVKAENGSTKNYVVNVIRKDDRSSNNYLSSLKVSNGTLKQSFNKNTTSYTMEVPYSVSSLNINATTEDSKAKVNITNNKLVAEETTTVNVIVTAENGSTKTYAINVKRGKDPNKVLSTNNYLKSLTVSNGILSPEFDKEKTNYIVYLPYEVTTIDINVEVEDTKYGILKKEENTNLIVGNNVMKYHVTAEDESVRTYIVTVVRGSSLDATNDSNNTYLKSLKMKNASLNKTFTKTTFLYKYKKNKKDVGIKEAIPEVESSKVTTYAIDTSFIIMVESQSGDKSFYILVPESTNILLYVIIFTILVLFIILFILLKKNNNKEESKENNKEEKTNKNKNK